MPQQFHIVGAPSQKDRWAKVKQAYLKGEQVLVEALIDGKHHTMSIPRGRKNFMHEIMSLFRSHGSRKRFSLISIESIDNDIGGIGGDAAFIQDVAMQSPIPTVPASPQGNRSSTIDFLANHGSTMPPSSARDSFTSPFTNAAVGEEIEPQEANELELLTSNVSDASSSLFVNQHTQSTRPVSFDPCNAMQALYAVGAQNRTYTTQQLPPSLRIGTARPNASLDLVVDGQDAPQGAGRRVHSTHGFAEGPCRDDDPGHFRDSTPANISDPFEGMGNSSWHRRSGYGGF